MWTHTCVFLLYIICIVAEDDLQIGVVCTEPERGARLAAAVDAALGCEEPCAVLLQAEPLEPLALPQAVCDQGGGLSALVGDVAALPAAVRAGLPLLLPSSAPSNDAVFALQLLPDPDLIAQACAEVCLAKGWSSAVLLHEGGAGGAARLASAGVDIIPHQLPPPEDDALLRNLLLVLKKFGAINFIIWCEAECAARVLDAAQRAGLLGARHSYLLLALDFHTLDLASYSHSGANITSIHLFDPESERVTELMSQWQRAYSRRLQEAAGTEPSAAASELVLAHDAARAAAAALKYLQLPAIAGASCTGCAAFHADTLLNYIRSEEWGGVGGALRWGLGGARRAAALSVHELQRGGRPQAVARWAPRTGLAWQRRTAPAPDLPSDIMTNRTFNILIALNDPYVMIQQSTERLSGNNRYEGYCIELIEKLAKILNFNYTFIEQENGVYGSYTPGRGWNGMMRRLMDDPDIHFAITDLTITADRERAVDFTTPFMNLGISILFRKPKPPGPAFFAFLLPFSSGVWVCLGFAYLGTSLVLYVVGRLCPEEWQNPYPCIEDPPALENQFTLANALWFNLGAVLLQGSEIAPVAYGTRAVASAWWLFALVITSSYTANLATLLAKKTPTDLIHNVQELADNPYGIKFGAKAGGSTYTFFEISQNALYQRMYQKMKDEKQPESNVAGIEKVRNENYAFFMESTSIEYNIERQCDITMVGEPLDSKGYGIAMKKNSEYRQAMNLALLNLQEAGELREMKQRWWQEMHGGGACKEEEEHGGEELDMNSFLGLFVVLVVGCALGVVVSFCDLAWSAARHPRDPTESYRRRLWTEIRFVFSLERSEKPLYGPLLPPTPESPARSGSGGLAELVDSASRDGSREGSAMSGGSLAEEIGSREQSPRLRPRTSARRSSMHAASLRLARHTTPRP
ncbi:glutamate receptor ionotropic, kainate 2 [Papilio machaon]|uniref:glutamate receptor ionotropic, kainate 2 n=1 Tax=Papilio machaon TaxID=76193 RepID=UPI001E66579B|nr:glutamate receptor ionotropic, kainate 2 [Papilio machaon]